MADHRVGECCDRDPYQLPELPPPNPPPEKLLKLLPPLPDVEGAVCALANERE